MYRNSGQVLRRKPTANRVAGAQVLCVCMCVCERERKIRERVRERGGGRGGRERGREWGGGKQRGELPTAIPTSMKGCRVFIAIATQKLVWTNLTGHAT
jgi:hypothetical protein